MMCPCGVEPEINKRNGRLREYSRIRYLFRNVLARVIPLYIYPGLVRVSGYVFRSKTLDTTNVSRSISTDRYNLANPEFPWVIVPARPPVLIQNEDAEQKTLRMALSSEMKLGSPRNVNYFSPK
jgi:hypothetical protein